MSERDRESAYTAVCQEMFTGWNEIGFAARTFGGEGVGRGQAGSNLLTETEDILQPKRFCGWQKVVSFGGKYLRSA